VTELTKVFRRLWGSLVQLACWVGVTVGTFIPEPPLTTLTAAPDVSLRRFAQFLGAVVLGMFLVFCQKWQKRSNTGAWIKVTVAIMILTLSAFFAERALRSGWTCAYAGNTITIGARLTRDAQAYSSTLRGEVTCDRLLAEYGGDALQVWDRQESERRYLMLSLLMIATWLLAASCIISVTQAVRCATATENPKIEPASETRKKRSG
jgi:hypothetical protein